MTYEAKLRELGATLTLRVVVEPPAPIPHCGSMSGQIYGGALEVRRIPGHVVECYASLEGKTLGCAAMLDHGASWRETYAAQEICYEVLFRALLAGRG